MGSRVSARLGIVAGAVKLTPFGPAVMEGPAGPQPIAWPWPSSSALPSPKLARSVRSPCAKLPRNSAGACGQMVGSGTELPPTNSPLPCGATAFGAAWNTVCEPAE